jgi:hypothetical protein
MHTLPSGLPFSAAAVSCYNVYAYAAGMTEPNFELLTEDSQSLWGRLATRAEILIDNGEGMKFHEIGKLVAHDWSRGQIPWDQVTDKQKLCWEAVARHLAYLINAEDIPDLQASERSWALWAQQKENQNATTRGPNGPGPNQGPGADNQGGGGGNPPLSHAPA